LLNLSGTKSNLLSREGNPVFSAETSPANLRNIFGTTLIFSRKRDIFELGFRALFTRRLVYWRHIPFQRGSRLRKILDMAFVVALSRLGQIVCVCDELAKEIRAVPLVAGDRVKVCYSPLEGSDAGQVAIRAQKANSEIHLVYFGREGAQKRLHDVLNLVDQARAEGFEIILSIFGYKAKPDILTDKPYIHFRGTTDSPISVLASSDGLILISEFEGFPTAMAEAAMCGAPIFCNAFRTGLEDFERLIGPVNRISPELPQSLALALQSVQLGSYNMKQLSRETILDQWRKVLD
jgi:glycosyltransferase involved in cell wall biosynthesis